MRARAPLFAASLVAALHGVRILEDHTSSGNECSSCKEKKGSAMLQVHKGWTERFVGSDGDPDKSKKANRREEIVKLAVAKTDHRKKAKKRKKSHATASDSETMSDAPVQSLQSEKIYDVPAVESLHVNSSSARYNAVPLQEDSFEILRREDQDISKVRAGQQETAQLSLKKTPQELSKGNELRAEVLDEEIQRSHGGENETDNDQHGDAEDTFNAHTNTSNDTRSLYMERVDDETSSDEETASEQEGQDDEAKKTVMPKEDMVDQDKQEDLRDISNESSTEPEETITNTPKDDEVDVEADSNISALNQKGHHNNTALTTAQQGRTTVIDELIRDHEAERESDSDKPSDSQEQDNQPEAETISKQTSISSDTVQQAKPERRFVARDDVGPEINRSKYRSTLSSMRAEMARRALDLEVGDEDEDEDESSEDVFDETSDSSMVSGATAELSEAGYSALATICCPAAMTEFASRLTTHLGFVVCDEGDLQGMVAWYYCKNQTRTFAELVEDTIAGADGDCAWVGNETYCPQKSSNCPYFPSTSAHRRRNCQHHMYANTTSTDTSDTTETTTPVPFQCDPARAIALDFARSEVTVSNLGGAGPDNGEAERLTFQGIATYEGSSVDLVVKTVSDYRVANSSDNGLSGHIGQINLRSGNSVEMKFSFQSTATKDAVSLPEFYLSFLDIDQSDNQHRERIYVDGFAHAVVEDVNDIEQELLSDGRTVIKSMQTGYTWDDPTDPLQLEVVADPNDAGKTVDQKKRAVMLVFRDTSEFTVTFEVTQGQGHPAMARNLRFAGESSLIDNCHSASDTSAASVASSEAVTTTTTQTVAASTEAPIVEGLVGTRDATCIGSGTMNNGQIAASWEWQSCSGISDATISADGLEAVFSDQSFVDGICGVKLASPAAQGEWVVQFDTTNTADSFVFATSEDGNSWSQGSYSSEGESVPENAQYLLASTANADGVCKKITLKAASE